MARHQLVLFITIGIWILFGSYYPQSASAGSAPLFHITVSSTSAEADNEVTLLIQADHVNDVYAFEVTVEFDSGSLQFASASSPIPGFTVSSVSDGNQVKFAHTLTGRVPGRSGSLILASMTFRTTGDHTAAFGLKGITLVNSRQVANEYVLDAKQAVPASDDSDAARDDSIEAVSPSGNGVNRGADAGAPAEEVTAASCT